MNFLEASKIVRAFAGGPPLEFVLAASGTTDKITVFLKAIGALRGRSVKVSTLPFNTLAQALLSEPRAGEREVVLLFPWDLIPELDWRTGLPEKEPDLAEIRAQAAQTAERLARRGNSRAVYVQAPIPPVYADPYTLARLGAWISALVADHGADLVDEKTFSLSSYLSTGCAIASSELSDLANLIITRAIGAPADPKKVLVTDLDNVMWHGIVGEDGVEGIQYRSEGAGFRHFLYQTLLGKLRREGALLAAVSRNDEELANAPFRAGGMVLTSDDFVVVLGSYSAKSAQIREIAQRLNLGLDSIVFVDDNPIELTEVGTALPEVRTVRFPDRDDALPEVLAEISALFARDVVTTEDASRTAMYRRRLEGMAPSEVAGADLTEFLRGLEMSLTIHDRSQGDKTRAVQLINKTNQFNLNGRRVTEEEVDALLADGGSLYTCTLADRTGSHGEILSCSIDKDGVIRSLVLSCRVFQRRVEHAFFVWLGRQAAPPHSLEFNTTPRNEPVRQFLGDLASGKPADGLVSIDWSAFRNAHESSLSLFSWSAPGATDDGSELAASAARRSSS